MSMLGSVVAVGLVSPPVAAATTSVDCASDPGALQPAIDAAEPGDVLDVSGICVGNFTISTSLTLQGSGTLDGNGSGTVLTVEISTVDIVDLTITNGSGVMGGGMYVEFFTDVHLRGSASVRGNSATLGGGIFVAGFVEMNDSSSVSGNTASVAGGGIYDRSGVVMNDSSSVSGNSASSSGGGVFVVEFRGLHVNDSASISGNRAARGGGVSASLDADVVLNGGASVSGNSATETGGGIESAGTLTLNGSVSVNGNRAGTKGVGGRGGGIATTATVNLNDGSKVQGNKAIGPGANGGGIYHVCDLFVGGTGVTLNGGRVKSNKPNDIVSITGDCV